MQLIMKVYESIRRCRVTPGCRVFFGGIRMDDLKNIVESLIFASRGPLDIKRLSELISEADAKSIKEAVYQLIDDYQTKQGGFFLAEVAGGFEFRTRPDYKQWVAKLRKPEPVRLSRAAMETLAVVAYHQPVLRSEVEQIRGVNSGNTLRLLLERKLIRILGRREVPGRPLIYGTTKRFLEVFSLKDLSELPTPEEFAEVIAGKEKEPSHG